MVSASRSARPLALQKWRDQNLSEKRQRTGAVQNLPECSCRVAAEVTRRFTCSDLRLVPRRLRPKLFGLRLSSGALLCRTSGGKSYPIVASAINAPTFE